MEDKTCGSCNFSRGYSCSCATLCRPEANQWQPREKALFPWGEQTPKPEMGKETAGKLELDLVPPLGIEEIAKVRMYGDYKKYTPGSWVNVPSKKWWGAVLRHSLAIAKARDLYARDAESGLMHLSHIMTSIAFIIELEGKYPSW